MSVRFARFTGEKVTFPTPDQGLCIGSFLVIEKKGQVLFGKAIMPEFAKGKWLLPASHLKFGEHPDEAVKRITNEQLSAQASSIKYRGVWNFSQMHWDMCFVYEVKLRGEPRPLDSAEVSKFPEGYFYSSQVFSELRYRRPNEIKGEIGRGHDEVLQASGYMKG